MRASGLRSNGSTFPARSSAASAGRRPDSAMVNRELHVVTGAFGYSGRYIASRLLREGVAVKTLTNSPDRENPFGGAVEAVPFHFEDPEALFSSLRGARVLYNTYWVRFHYREFGFEEAVRNTTILFQAAARAGVERIVHVSISNPSSDSDLEYFRGKGILEERLAASGVSYAILRPTVLFGREDILINNIAWLLRKFPLFCVFGDGRYRLQPIYVGDLADLAVRAGRERRDEVIEAIGPETYTFRELVELIGGKIGARRPIAGIPPALGAIVGRMLGLLLRDVVITRPEIEGLMRGLLHVDAQPAGTTRLSDWLDENAGRLGIRYASELARRRDRRASYTSPST